MFAHVAAAAAKLRILAPYAAMELILPGGSLMALLFWLYRRQKMRAAAGHNPGGRLLGHRQRRAVGVAARDHRHGAGVDRPQVLDAA
jgi:hypothetical protein